MLTLHELCVSYSGNALWYCINCVLVVMWEFFVNVTPLHGKGTLLDKILEIPCLETSQYSDEMFIVPD